MGWYAQLKGNLPKRDLRELAHSKCIPAKLGLSSRALRVKITCMYHSTGKVGCEVWLWVEYALHSACSLRSAVSAMTSNCLAQVPASFCSTTSHRLQ